MAQNAPEISTYCTERPLPWEVVPYISEAKDDGQATGLQKTPIHSLPVELLCNIFELGLERERLSHFAGSPKYLYRHSQYQIPLSLLRVCRVWRRVALDTGSLWNSIAPSQNSVAFMRRWLEMSPKVPLDLAFPQRYSMPGQDDGDYTSRMFRLFAEEAYRWQSLSIELDKALATELLALMESNIGTALPIKNLTIRVDLHEALDEIADIISLLRSFKSLERLNWACLAEISLEHIPWSQLKVVIIRHLSSPAQFVNYLSKCTSSTTVSFSPFSKYQHQDLPFPQLQRSTTSLPNLTSLILSRVCDPIRMLQFFVLPSLHTLRIEVQKRDLIEVEQLLKKTPSLRSLAIDEWGVKFIHDNQSRATDEDIIGYLTSPYIRRLPRFQIAFYKAYNRGITIIRTHPDPENNFPHLVCWKAKWLFAYIGWGFDVDEATQLLWRYDGGILVLTPLYTDLWAVLRG